MKPERQRIVIAEANGFTDIRPGVNACAGLLRGVRNRRYELVPNYPQDRDSIIRAILALNATETLMGAFLWSPRCEFLRQLEIVVSRNHPEMGARIQFALITASAEELCEAYLRAISKWEES